MGRLLRLAENCFQLVMRKSFHAAGAGVGDALDDAVGATVTKSEYCCLMETSERTKNPL